MFLKLNFLASNELNEKQQQIYSIPNLQLFWNALFIDPDPSLKFKTSKDVLKVTYCLERLFHLFEASLDFRLVQTIAIDDDSKGIK